LSLAQRQKLGLARAIVKRPEMLILYDPVGPLDLREQIDIRDRLLAELAGRTVIWAVQHEEWAAVFEEVVELHDGRLVRHGPPDGSGEPHGAGAKLVPAQ
jgi:putative ABC transport system ATP-binding protein